MVQASFGGAWSTYWFPGAYRDNDGAPVIVEIRVDADGATAWGKRHRAGESVLVGVLLDKGLVWQGYEYWWDTGGEQPEHPQAKFTFVLSRDGATFYGAVKNEPPRPEEFARPWWGFRRVTKSS